MGASIVVSVIILAIEFGSSTDTGGALSATTG
jgi:hypothetical protein